MAVSLPLRLLLALSVFLELMTTTAWSDATTTILSCQPAASSEPLVVIAVAVTSRCPKSTNTSYYAHRGGGFWLMLQVMTSKKGKPEDPQKAALADAWLTKTCKELEPHVIEKGVGCISPSTTPVAGTRTQGAEAAVMFPPVNVFGDAARVEKLRAIKTKYDPTNVFKAVENGLTGAHNIEPDRV